MSNENNRKVCPFSNQECLEDKCALWATEITITKPGMLAPQKMPMCAFQAIVLLEASPKMMMMPQPTNLGGILRPA